ncbi:peptidoglycan-binding protein [Streptomyces sp. NBC_00390]|uniref:peptidoglycan-binding domain-containing protein n=1 Tax=Streptomyces sp. NBC_00390 TaxID=2975736 RepID=UPI002E20B022
MTGQACPRCGTPGRADGPAASGCGCGGRMGDALGAEWQEQAGATEGFDPLRIRPYVTWEVTGTGGSGSAGPPPAPMAPHPAPVQVPPYAAPPGPLPDLAGVDDTDTQELELVTVGGAGHRAEPARSRALTGLMAGAAAVAVAGTVAFAAGLFSGDGEGERALPDSTRNATSVSIGPDAPSASASPTGSASPSASVSTSASPSASTSASASASGKPSPTGPSVGTAPGGSTPGRPSVSPSPSTVQATDSEDGRSGRRTLRPGDSGPSVEELQRRLDQLRLYEGPFDGEYDADVEEAVRRYQWARGIDRDPEGVYGRDTRRALESETYEP